MKMIFFKFFCLLLYCAFVWSHIFTLNKNNNLKCVLTGEAVYSAAYITSIKNPYLLVPKFIRPINKVPIDLDDDWEYTNALQFPFGSVLDQRWESFDEKKSFDLDLTVSVSVYTNSKLINLISFDENGKNYNENPIKLNSFSDYRWFHLTFKSYDDKVETFLDGKLFNNIKTYKRKIITVQDNIIMKLHNYTFNYSENNSTNVKQEYNIVFKDEACLSMLVSVDNNCFLDITLKSKTNQSLFNKTEVVGFNKKQSLKLWKRIEIRSKFSGNGTLMFERRTKNNTQTKSFWAIDQIEYCKKELETFNVISLPPNCLDCQCKTLTESRLEEGTFFEKPGYLSRNINCTNILGKSQQYCEKHRICFNNKCNCAWGYQGFLCEIPCVSGYWGINCSQKCNLNCKCNHKKGCISVNNTTIAPFNRNTIFSTSNPLNISTSTSSDNVTEKPKLNKSETNKSLIEPLIILSSRDKIMLSLPSSTKSKNFCNYNITVVNWKTGKDLKPVNNTKPISSPRKCNYTVLVDHKQKYKIGIKDLNKFQKAKIELNLTIFSPSNNFPLKPVVESCTKKCSLLLPVFTNFNKNNTTFVVTKRGINAEELEERYKTLLDKTNKEDWIVDPVTVDTNRILLDIGPNKYNGVSLENKTFTTYFISNGNGSFEYYPLTFEENATNILNIILLVVTVTVPLTSMIITIWIVRKKINASEESDIIVENIPLRKIERVFNCDIKREDLEEYISYNLKSKEFEKQFEQLSHSVKKETSWEAVRYENLNKNKDKRAKLPYDYNRVILRKMKGVGSSNYINASYIHGFDRRIGYIASQAPKFHTVNDFWRMVWQENIETIVMATNIMENQQRMCAEYWPQRLNAVVEFGSINIILVKEEYYEYYTKRKLEVCYHKFQREVCHIHVKWKSDNKQFPYSNDLLPIVKLIKKNQEHSIAPILIHSGYGTNRTGTLILCNLALQMLEVDGIVDFYTLTKQLNEQRNDIISSPQYYMLAHLVVLHYLIDEKSPFHSHFEEDIKNSIKFNKENLQELTDYLEKVCQHDKTVYCWNYNNESNNLPINYNFVDGYGRPKKYLVKPLPINNYSHKFAEFWTVITEEQIKCIIFLNKLKKNVKLWPFRIEYGDVIIKVECLNCTKTSTYKMTEISVMIYNKFTSVIQYRENITFYEVIGKNNQTPILANNILKLIIDTRKYSPIAISCSDGTTMCGLFIILSYIIEKYENELEIDVCNAIRVARRSGKKFINTSEQLKFVYECISEYLQNFESYNIISK